MDAERDPTPEPRAEPLATTRRRVLGWGAAAAAAAAAGPTLAACGVDDPGQLLRAPTAKTQPDPVAVRPAVTASNRFAFDLHRAVATHQAANVVVGPTAVAGALAMVRLGASGATRLEIEQALHLDGTVPPTATVTLDQLIAERVGQRANDDRTGRVRIATPRGLWAPRGTPLDGPFLDRMAAELDTGVRVIDFRSDPEVARGAINGWAREATDDAIADLLPAGSVESTTRLLSLSAAAVQAPWDLQFTATRTRPGPFTLADGTIGESSMMSVAAQGAILAGEIELDGIGPTTVADIPYLGRQLSLVLIAPPAGAFATLEQRLDAELLGAAIQSLVTGTYDLRLPRFSIRTSIRMDTALADLGVRLALSTDHADFSPITADGLLHVSAAWHEASFRVDEEGSGAQAATLSRRQRPAPPAERSIVIDRPFAFVVRDRLSDLVLLTGRVVTP